MVGPEQRLDLKILPLRDFGQHEVIGLNVHLKEVGVYLLLLFQLEGNLLVGSDSIFVELYVVLNPPFSELDLGVVILAD